MKRRFSRSGEGYHVVSVSLAEKMVKAKESDVGGLK